MNQITVNGIDYTWEQDPITYEIVVCDIHDDLFASAKFDGSEYVCNFTYYGELDGWTNEEIGDDVCSQSYSDWESPKVIVRRLIETHPQIVHPQA